jgi:ribosomal protein S18 acetylase RimI-like enzyme
MIQAAYKDKALILNILIQAFDANKSVNYTIKQDQHREKRIRKLMEYSFELCWEWGEIYLTTDKKGVVLMIYPHNKEITLNSIWQDFKLVLGAIGISRVAQMVERESKIKKFHPKEFIYLWYLGVDPQFQGKGIGSILLQDIINLGNKMKLPIYLETSNERNLLFFERFKFLKYQELNFGYTLHMYKKEPT